MFDKLSYERMSETKYLSKQIDFNDLIYYFKNENISSVNFIDFKDLLHLYKDVFNGDVTLTKAEQDQNQFKLYFNDIITGNPNKKSKDQLDVMKNIKNLYESREKVNELYNDYVKLDPKLFSKQNRERD